MNQLSVLKLFKGYIGEKTADIRKEGLKYGLLVPESASDEIMAEAIKLYGMDAEAWNRTFHKSWNKVATAPIEELFYEQLVHYLTTYGFEDLGIFSHESVYIPHEKLEIPELEEDVELISIRAYTEDEVREKLMTLLTSGIALSKGTLTCLKDLTELIDISRFDEIQNREARIILCDAFGIAPEDPDEFLRYVIYKATGNTLKIQDQMTIDALKVFSRKELLELFSRYLKDDESLKKLASVFLRNKRLFLAMKTSEPKNMTILSYFADQQLSSILKNEKEEARQINHLINRLAKKARTCHQPLSLNRLDRLTAPSTQINNDELLKALDKITVFRELRILNSLSYVLNGSEAIVYRIRNGRSFATKRKEPDEEGKKLIGERYRTVKEHLINRLRPALEGKTVYMPEDMNYKVPTSEKQFVGNIPCGSSYTADRDSDIIFGIHWTNLEDGSDPRVDLDLHTQNLEVSYGWNSAYRSDEKDIYFSGDTTDAPLPEGASELFYIGQNVESTFMFSVNNYTYQLEKIPFTTVLAKAPKGVAPNELNSGHLVDPNGIIMKFPMEMAAGESMMRLGFVYFTEDTIRIVFDSFSGDRLRVSDNEDPVFMNTFNYLTTSQETSLSLKELLQECNVTFVTEADREKAAYDLSLDSLTKETLIGIFSVL